jgi:hypothetical protein
MKTPLCSAAALILMAGFTFAQTPAEQMSPLPSASPSTQPVDPNMQQMAKSMGDMAQMCQMMMQKEAAAARFLVAVAVIFGVLLFLALLLLVVLEVQWIIYWKRLLRIQERGNSL